MEKEDMDKKKGLKPIEAIRVVGRWDVSPCGRNDKGLKNWFQFSFVQQKTPFDSFDSVVQRNSAMRSEGVPMFQQANNLADGIQFLSFQKQYPNQFAPNNWKLWAFRLLGAIITKNKKFTKKLLYWCFGFESRNLLLKIARKSVFRDT